MSAFGGKADIAIKRGTSAFDPQQTLRCGQASHRDAFQQILPRETKDFELTFAFDEVVLPNALEEKK
jgi:hypothetical protein